jgi:hypothetical protein
MSKGERKKKNIRCKQQSERKRRKIIGAYSQGKKKKEKISTTY